MGAVPSKEQCLVLGAYLVNLIGTYLSNTSAYGKTNAEVSNQFHTIITPPGYAFSIWALIFVWQGVACVAQCLPRFRDASVFPRVSRWGWALTCASQVIWSVAFAQESIKLSMALITLIWLGLLLTTVGLKHPSSDDQLVFKGAPASLSRAATWLLLKAPFSLHFGWISAAMCVNGEVVAVAGCETFARQVTLAILTLAFLSTMLTQTSVVRSDVSYAAAVCWALLSLRDRDTRKAVCTPQGLLSPPPAVAAALTDASTGIGSVFIVLAALRAAANMLLPPSVKSHVSSTLNDTDSVNREVDPAKAATYSEV